MSSEGKPQPDPFEPAPERLRYGRPPFALLPDVDFLFWTPAHRQAADALHRGIANGSPVILLTGEIGAGKTMLLHGLFREQGSSLAAGFLPFVGSDRAGLMAATLLAFGLPMPAGPLPLMFTALESFVLAEHEAGRRSILIVDEAQSASDDELEALRQLTNIYNGRRTLLQVVLAGHPELRARLGEGLHAALAARIGADAHLPRMREEDTAAYVRHRLACAGGDSGAFTPEALSEIHRIAGGIARATNHLCDLCLTEAESRGAGRVEAAFVRDVAAAARRRGCFVPLGAPRSSGTVHVLPSSRISRSAAAEPPQTATAESSASQGATPGAPRRNLSPEPARKLGSAAQPSESQASAAGSRSPTDSPGRNSGTLASGSGGAAAPTPTASDEEVRLLAFQAMASLPDYGTAPDKVQQSRQARTGPSPTRPPGRQEPTSAAATPGPSSATASPSPCPRRRSLGLGLPATGVALAIIGFACHVAWSVVDAASRVSDLPNPSAAAASAVRLAQTSGPSDRSHAKPPLGGSDRAAERGAHYVPRSALTTPALPTIAEPQMTATDIYELGLDLGLVDQATAAIAFARAASRGHARAAFYLGQLYETGDGVPRNLSLARAWYAASDIAVAKDRLAALAAITELTAAGQLSAPVLRSAARTSDAKLELVWSSAADVEGNRYLVEVLDAASMDLLHAERVAGSSLRLPASPRDLLWRVTLESPLGSVSADLQRIPAAD